MKICSGGTSVSLIHSACSVINCVDWALSSSHLNQSSTKNFIDVFRSGIRCLVHDFRIMFLKYSYSYFTEVNCANDNNSFLTPGVGTYSVAKPLPKRNDCDKQ